MNFLIPPSYLKIGCLKFKIDIYEHPEVKATHQNFIKIVKKCNASLTFLYFMKNSLKPFLDGTLVYYKEYDKE